jgi:hypothetical protein
MDRSTYESWPEGRSIPSIGWFWTDRNGDRHVVTFPVTGNDWEAAEAETREKAMAHGYPGHKGGWWNYLVDDFRNWLARRGWVANRGRC